MFYKEGHLQMMSLGKGRNERKKNLIIFYCVTQPLLMWGPPKKLQNWNFCQSSSFKGYDDIITSGYTKVSGLLLPSLSWDWFVNWQINFIKWFLTIFDSYPLFWISEVF